MKFLDQILAAMASKDDAAIKAVVMKARDAEEEEEEEKRKKEEETKDKALDARFKGVTDSLPKLIGDAVSRAVSDCMKEYKDGEEKEDKEKKAKEEEERKKAEDAKSEEELEEEAPKEKAKDARKAKDSALLEDSFNTVKMQAEIIAPGVQIPTFDRAADPKTTFRDCVCGLRRKALVQGLGNQKTSDFIETVRGKALDGAGIAALSCGDTRTLFNGVYALQKQHNNTASTGGGHAAASTRTGDEQQTPMQKFKAASDRRNGFTK